MSILHEQPLLAVAVAYTSPFLVIHCIGAVFDRRDERSWLRSLLWIAALWLPGLMLVLIIAIGRPGEGDEGHGVAALVLMLAAIGLVLSLAVGGLLASAVRAAARRRGRKSRGEPPWGPAAPEVPISRGWGHGTEGTRTMDESVGVDPGS
jgi:peptidoglycan/LPS O-acetylase OafA/YrhL